MVDDDRILVKVVCKWLNELGYATLSAFSVAEALKMLASRSVNLVIVDLDMPDVRGTALIQQMKAFNRTNSIRIIVLSGRWRKISARSWRLVLMTSCKSLLSSPRSNERSPVNSHAR